MKVKDLNISKLATFSKEKLNKIRREVLLDNELIEIPSILLPDVFESSYYFVSYSHKDFRCVYNDIITLNEQGLNVWYDRGIPAGKNWKDIANDYMFPSECRGVIFYLSENSLLSNAVIDEIQYAKKLKKPVVVVMLPYKEKYYSPTQLLKLLKDSGLDISEKKLRDLSVLIPDEQIYIPYNMDSSMKIEKIIKCAPEIPSFETVTVTEEGKHKRLRVTKLNNYKISKIDEETLELTDDYSGINFVPALCANAQLLETISFPDKYKIEVGSFAFYGCKSLVNLDIKSFKLGMISVYGFAGCTSLENVNLHGIALIEEKAFSKCTSLKKLTLDFTHRIRPRAFYGCSNLETVDLGCASEIGDSAFEGCTKLKKIKWNLDATYKQSIFSGNKAIKKIELDFSDKQGRYSEWTFAEMYGLKEIFIRNSDRTLMNNVPEDLFYRCENLEKATIIFSDAHKSIFIDDHAFEGCAKLKEVNFNVMPTTISDKAFFECKELDTLFSSEKGTLDLSEVSEIKNKVFAQTSFRKVILGEKLLKIGLDVFLGCDNLTEIHINNKNINLSMLLVVLGQSNENRRIEVYFKGTKDEFNTHHKLKNYIYNFYVHCDDGDLILHL